ncbi:MAG: S-layer homology domain-containing protein, partial [Kiritimatiellaeota bacterium]|nr:S-layer homology domain-containing protein [Kiritimatiellota bacterium]
DAFGGEYGYEFMWDETKSFIDWQMNHARENDHLFVYLTDEEVEVWKDEMAYTHQLTLDEINAQRGDQVATAIYNRARELITEKYGDGAALSSGYVYDEADPGASVSLPVHLLEGVVDLDTAVAAVRAAASGMTDEQKRSAAGADLATLFAEEAVAQAASAEVSGGDVAVSLSSVRELQGLAGDVGPAVERALSENGVAVVRDLQADVVFRTDSASVTITIDPSAAGTVADNIRVEAPGFAVTFPAEAVRADAVGAPLVVTVSEMRNDNAEMRNSGPGTGGFRVERTGNGFAALAGAGGRSYSVAFSRPVGENVKVSFPAVSGDTDFQAVMNSRGDAVGGKYNPITSRIEARIRASDTYSVRNNRKDFTDISGKSREMQDAIAVLASKGIIAGTTETTFSPDASITRAEIAALIVRTLAKVDPDADGGFEDVRRSDWFFGAVGSASRHGIVNGTSPTEFAPRSNIQKDQIVAMCARTLRSEMGYRAPPDVAGALRAYADSGSIAQWGHEDIALATRENLVVRRADGMFNGRATMTRGDAAIVLYRMFMKIW